MPVLTAETAKMQLPQMVKVRQHFGDSHLTDIVGAIRRELHQEKIRSLLRPGQSVAVAVGSRGISNLSTIVKETVRFLREFGAVPFIVPAMGSHGGATAEGQLAVLHSYGVTEAELGVPIKSSMAVSLLDHTPQGIPVYMDKTALAADMTVLINRVKPHTNFRGSIESGLAKMCAIGLGKHVGCSRLHEEGWEEFSSVVSAVAEVFLAKANIGFGIALVENAFEQTAVIKTLTNTEILREEPKLQAIAKGLMPALLVPDIDVLVVEELGKDISGSGMDPNIIGKSASRGKMAGFTGPDIKRIVVLNLSKGTHGNACGIGCADFTTKAVFDSIDFVSTYANLIAAGSPEAAKIPIVLETEQEAVISAVKCCGVIGEKGPRIVRIKDTLHLGDIWVSENMLPLVRNNDRLEIDEGYTGR